MAEKAAAAEPEALEPREEGKVRHGLDMPLLPLQEDSGKPQSPPQDALTKGMGKCRLEAPLLPPQDSLSEGKRGPQWTPQEMP